MRTATAPARPAVHTFVSLANPFLVCGLCRRQVSAWHDARRCGCRSRGPGANLPCGHPSGTESVCPTWTRLGGCRCRRLLGGVDHPHPLELRSSA